MDVGQTRAREMTSCPLCAKSKEPGWLCAEHPRKPWEHDGRGAERTLMVEAAA